MSIPAGTGAITFGNTTWSSNKASVQVSTTTGYQIEYQVNSTSGTWTKISSGGKIGNLNHNDNVYARLTDGNNVGSHATLVIIDNTPPTVSISTSNLTYNSVKLTVTASDGQSGLADSGRYTYYLNNTQKASNNTNSYTFTGLSGSTKYTLKVVVKDKAGKTTEKTTQITTTAPPPISSTASYVGCYADVDGNGSVDGVIYADLAIGGSGQWGSISDGTYTIPKGSNFKTYTVSGSHTENGFGTKDVIKVTNGSGNERFYVMALSNVDSSTHYWYYAAYGNMDDYANATSGDFGAGEKNTQTMISKWNSIAYGSQNASSSLTDMWGLRAVQSGTWNGSTGWYVPSRGEWSAFGAALGITSSNYTNFGLSTLYWSSSQYNSERAWSASFYYGYMSGSRVNSEDYVRLSTTF